MGESGFSELQDTVVRPRSMIQRRLPYLLVAIVLLFFGLWRFVFAFASANSSLESSASVADPEDYEVSLSTCDSDGGTPIVAGTISNFRSETGRYEVYVQAIDAETAEVIAAGSVDVTVEQGQSEPFEMGTVNMSDVTGWTTPESVVCETSVFYAS